MKLPKARTENIVVQHLKDEILTYDMLTHEAYCLNSTAAIVYGACDGLTTFEELSRHYKYPADLIYLTLDNLRDKNLLADEYRSIFESISRREVIKKVGLATMIALPLIAGLVAPSAAQAASGVGGSGESSGVGNYDQACLSREVPVAGTIKYCYSDLECGSTSKGERCCVRRYGNSSFFYSGEGINYPTDYRSPYYFPVDSAPTTSNDCSGEIRCCDGAMPTGTCTYTRYQGEDGGDYDDPGPVLGLYFRSCDCTCP